jgi:hypothetical protein
VNRAPIGTVPQECHAFRVVKRWPHLEHVHRGLNAGAGITLPGEADALELREEAWVLTKAVAARGVRAWCRT